jgi:pimeloyl-ACP methyl ester carboxylesterase
MTTFIVVHGAWSGAWAWSRVAVRLRAEENDVHVPTLSGLGERTHLAQMPITLGTHIDDVANEILFHDLTDVVLVMHSYGSFVGAAVAERLADHIAALVFVDAFVPKDGDRLVDMLPSFEVGPQVTPPPKGGPEDYLDEADWRWASSKATAHPSATLTEGVRLTGAYLNIPKKTYVLATDWDGFQSIAAPLRSRKGWKVVELNCGHDVAIDMPDELAAILLGLDGGASLNV